MFTQNKALGQNFQDMAGVPGASSLCYNQLKFEKAPLGYQNAGFWGYAVTAYSYNKAFMLYAGRSSAYSAWVITALLSRLIAPKSVLDVGCATGTWLKAWSAHLGNGGYHGVDGAHVSPAMLEIPAEAFTAANLDAGFDLGRTFDLVQCLEVAEHIDPACAERLVSCLARHSGRFVLFSAAPPGQGGERHINERPYEYWRGLLARGGFAALDVIRGRIAPDKRISYWYRYNMFLYARRECISGLNPALQAAVAPEDAALADVSPPMFRLRKAAIRRLPYGLQHNIAKLKARLYAASRSSQ